MKTVLNTQEGRLAAGVNCDPCPTGELLFLKRLVFYSCCGNLSEKIDFELKNLSFCLFLSTGCREQVLFLTIFQYFNYFSVCASGKLSGGSYVGSWQEAVYRIKDMNPGEPVRPFFRGCWARVISVAPGCALSWLAYEFMKTLLNAENSQRKTDTPGWQRLF